MLSFIDKLSHITMKAIRDILTVFIYGILIVSVMYINADTNIFNNSISMSSIFISFFLNYLIGYLLSYYILKNTNSDSKIRVVLFVFALFFAIANLLLLAPSLSFGYKAFFFVLYLITWNNGMKAAFEYEDIIETKNKILINTIIILILLLINYLFQNDMVIQKIIEVYLPVYFVISILYLMYLSLIKAYIGKGKNTINMSKNMRIFSILSITVAGFIFVLLISNFFGLGDLKIVSQIIDFVLKIIEKILVIIFYPIVFLMSKLSEIAGDKLDKNDKLLDNFKESNKQMGNRLEGIIDINNPTVDIVLDILKWAIFSIIIFFIVYSIWKKIKENYNRGLETSDEGEEKDFVLTSKYIRQIINRRLNDMQNRIKNLVNKNENDTDSLHVIRRLYIGAVLELNKKGYSFKRYNTPNEYLLTINDDKYINAGFDRLTQCYNEVRYGHKETKSSVVSECIYIKGDIDKID